MKWKILFGDACTGCQSAFTEEFFDQPEEHLVTLKCGISTRINYSHYCPQIGTLNLFTLAEIETPDWAER